MKTTLLNSLTGWVATTALLVALPAMAIKAPQVEALKKSLKSVPVLEMPAKAAQAVTEAKVDERDSVALAVIVAAAQVKPAALVPVVSAVIRVVPELAADIASTAVAQQPKQAGAITQAAVAAAPSQADKIVRAVAAAQPLPSSKVAETASMPPSGPPVVLPLVLPSGPPTPMPLAGPPVVGGPFTGLPETPTDINRTNTVVVPPGGGRDYSSP